MIAELQEIAASKIERHKIGDAEKRDFQNYTMHDTIFIWAAIQNWLD